MTNAPPTPDDWFPSATTKAADYAAARQRGERLPQHLLPEDLEEAIAIHLFNEEHAR